MIVRLNLPETATLLERITEVAERARISAETYSLPVTET